MTSLLKVKGDRNLFVDRDDVIVFFLPRDELVDDVEELRWGGFEVFMKVPLDGKRCEDVVVDESWTQIGEDTWRVFHWVFEQVPSDDVIQDGVSQKLKSKM